MPRALRSIVATLMVASTFILLPATAARASTTTDVLADADWVMQAAAPDGAISHYVDRTMVRPYLSHFASLGLVHAFQTTGQTRYLDAAWRWLSWYQAHMDSAGYVTDYDLVGGQLVSTGDMDSTDSYAAMFLVAVYNAHRATGSGSRTALLGTGISKAVSAIVSTQQADGLTWAKPTFRAKYLMDQAETYAGLRAASWLAANVLALPALADRATTAANALKAGVDRLWNPATGAYDWAVHENGARTPNSWANLYPDSLSQVWAVAFGLVDTDPARSQAILQRFEAAHPAWDQPAAIDQFDGGRRAVEYWPVAGWAYGRVGNLARADQAAARIGGAAATAGRAWPFHTMAAGQLISLRVRTYDVFPSGLSTTKTSTIPKPRLRWWSIR